MEENEIALPIDLKYIKDSTSKRILHKIRVAIRICVRRIVDIVTATILLMLVIPFSILIKFIYCLNGDFKSIFTITKCFGKNGKIINVIKYRSVNKDGTVNRLRITALDNLPKVINVLFGSMSIVGPQPYEVSDKEKMGAYFNRIVQMKPGITGISQISYIEDYSFEKRMDNDVRYFYGKNWFLDLKIVLITILITLPRRNKEQLLSYLNILTKDIGRLLVKFINNIVKRTIDILGSLVGILALIPLTIAVFIINILTGDKGPIFYSQNRIGKNGKVFKMYKFRSMVVDADKKLKDILENDAEAEKEYKKYKKLKNDPRITVAGKFLRKTSIDEFPQFVNVLKGEMSLVGPRPYLEGEVGDMKDCYNIITEHKPGITGLWQVTGRSDVSFNDRLELDMIYHKDSNCLYDVKILGKTVVKVLKHEGVA